MFQLYRMPFSIFYFCLTYFYLIASVVIRRVYRKRMGRIRFVPVWMFLMPIICCTTAQLLSYGISLAWCSVSIGLVSMHMSLQNELAYLNPLTKLFNRNYLNHILKQFSYLHTEVYGIMLDMDHFKSINDTYGHDEGDAALMEAANILFSSLTENAVPVRFAGDEFMILIPSGTEETANQIIQNIRREEAAFNESGKSLMHCCFPSAQATSPHISAQNSFSRIWTTGCMNRKNASRTGNRLRITPVKNRSADISPTDLFLILLTVLRFG